MANPGQAGSLGAHAETNRAVWSARARGSQAVDPALTSKIYDTVDESVAEPAACWGKARPLQPPAQPYAQEYHITPSSPIPRVTKVSSAEPKATSGRGGEIFSVSADFYIA